MGKASSSSAVTTRRASSSSASPTVAAAAAKSSTTAAVATDMKRKKKKGRPSLLDLQIRQQQLLQKAANSNSNKTPNSNKTLASPSPSKVRRSTRRNPLNSDYEDDDDDEDDDDEDEREQKKVKLVVRLPQSSQPRDSVSRNSSANSSDGEDSDEINAAGRRSTDAGADQGEKVVKMMATVRGGGSSLGSGPTTPLPDKTLLVFVLDRLQKKDTYGVFSEPVDPNELPDYHEIVKRPMDFGTVRKKLNGGAYSKLEEIEADVMLICANAMKYNSADTVYYRQARTIQDLARRDFANLRNEGDNGEPAPKVVRRGRPPSNKNTIKKPVTASSPAADRDRDRDRIGLEASPGVPTPASEDKPSGGSNGYNLRKAPPMFYKFRSNDGTPLRSRNGENYSDWLVDWNSEFPASILRADMKYGKKHFADVDEGRRDTYKQFHPSASSQQSYFPNSFEDSKRLIAVGLHVDPHAYARSVARYAGNLGPAVWAVACKKLKNALPDGLPFGPGWVEENDTPLPFSPVKSILMNGSFPTANNTPVADLRSIQQPGPSGEMSEAGRRVFCKNEFQVPHKSTFQVPRNGFNGMFGFDQQSQTGMSRLIGQQPGILYQNSNSEEAKLPENWNFLRQQIPGSAVQQQPDLNIRAQASGSPSSSSLQIGSPPPDLALQL